MNQPKYKIRKAEKGDINGIYSMIQELAEYEKLLDQFHGSKERLETHLFHEPAYVHALVAEYEKSIVGYAIYFYNYSTFLTLPGIYLEDLYVKPEYRHQGIGKAFFEELKNLCKQEKLGRLEWAVLNWNSPAKDFYNSMGANIFEEWQICRIEFK